MSRLLQSAGKWLFNFHLDARLGRTPIWTAIILVLCTTGLGGVYVTQHSLIQTIGVDTTPSIEAAHRVKNYGAQLVADVVLEVDAPTGANYDLVKDSIKQGSLLDAAMQYAIAHITYADDSQHLYPSEPRGELGPIERLQADITLINQEIGKIRVLHERKDAAVLSSSRHLLNTLLVEHLIPDADALANVNQAHFDYAYQKDSKRATLTTEAYMTLLLFGGLTIVSLMVTQLYLGFFRFKRAFNPFWIASTVIAVSFFLYVGIAIQRAGHEEFNAGTNAYPSVVSLMDARAHVLEARAEESMWLLDREPTESVKHEKRYHDQMDMVAKVAGGHSFDQACAEAKAGKKVTSMTGALADELNNITYPGEMEAACSAVQKFVVMVKIDAQIRDLENRGMHEQAVAMMIGNDPGQMVYAFKQFDDESGTGGALGTALKINQEEQDASIQNAFAWVNPLELRIPVATVSIEVLVVLGMLFLRFLCSSVRFARRAAALSASTSA